MELMALLRAETVAHHSRLEALPYFAELIAHRLPLECYVNQLRALSIIHSVLEEQIAASVNEQLVGVWQDGLRKLPLLMADLHFFEPRISSDNISSIEAALAVTKNIRLRSIEQPCSLLGYLYVMEGSTLGNHMHQPDIAKSYYLDGLDGNHYYSSYKDKVKTRWQQFAQKMNKVLDAPELRGPVVEAAHESFAGLEVLYNQLFPLKKSNDSFHVARINPEAGNHPIPADKKEIEAALNASGRCWSEYFYYEKRYGKRGKRFSDSDFCWLTTLTALDEVDVQKQVDWLCRVLAARGMPSIMLESTLYCLSEELVTALPENRALYQKLCNSAGKLKANRLKYVEEKVFNNLAEEFEQSVQPNMRKVYGNTGLLLVSAVIDEKNGIPGSLSALQQWFVDSDRFSSAWIAAVEKTIHKAKKIVLEQPE